MQELRRRDYNKGMLTVSIQGNFDRAREEIRIANGVAECIEFRLDLMEKSDLAHISKLKSASKLPIIFTLRCRAHGGSFTGNEREREEKFLELLTLKPDYVDLEWDAPFTLEIPPETQLIISYHNFEETPANLDDILKKMRKIKGAMYKIATMAHSSLDSLRMLSLVEKENNIAGMCMGKMGEITRILAPIVDSALIYSNIEKETAPGQLPIHELQNLYHFHRLNRSTKIYALIGDPVEQSIGHLVHNHHFRKVQVDAVYVKIPLRETELSEFFRLIRFLPFKGLSITMPLKEKVGSYLDVIDPDTQKIGAVNTFARREEKWFGINTDGRGALDALEKKGKVAGKVVLIIGAGGAAKAIAFEVARRGGKVVIVNRSHEKGKRLAQLVGGSAISFEEIDVCPYDFLINTTSVGMGEKIGESPFTKKEIKERVIALDVISHPKRTLFLSNVIEKKGDVVFGSEMFAHQALGQLRAWNIPIKNEGEFHSFIEALSLR